MAEVLFERVKSDLDHASDRELEADRAGDFMGWALLDPRAAVARLEKVRISPGPDLNADLSRPPSRSSSACPTSSVGE